MRVPKVMVYGGSGFTARLVLENLRARGIPFVVAGRNRTRIEQIGDSFGAPTRVFGLTDAGAVARGMAGVNLLLNAAGPFGETTAPLIRACLDVGAHYLDVSGEVAPLELVARLDAAARARGIMLLPAVGFDVVPSDCLAMHLARRLPDADELTLSIQGSDLLSRGSARSFASHAGVPVLVRKAGRLESLLYRTQVRFTDFGSGPRPTIATSWGDLVTAFRSTGIRNIEVYFEATPPRFLGVSGNQYFGWMYRSSLAKTWFRKMAELVPEAPADAERERHGALIHGEARKGKKRVRSIVATSEAYTFTGLAAGAVVERVLAGSIATGFQTPGTLFGPDFALRLGAIRRDLP